MLAWNNLVLGAQTPLLDTEDAKGDSDVGGPCRALSRIRQAFFKSTAPISLPQVS